MATLLCLKNTFVLLSCLFDDNCLNTRVLWEGSCGELVNITHAQRIRTAHDERTTPNNNNYLVGLSLFGGALTQQTRARTHAYTRTRAPPQAMLRTISFRDALEKSRERQRGALVGGGLQCMCMFGARVCMCTHLCEYDSALVISC